MIDRAVAILDYIMKPVDYIFEYFLAFKKRKDGGSDSPVQGYWVIEIKRLFSIVILRFDGGSRENFHSHAFNALTWWVRGSIEEHRIVDGKKVITTWTPSLIPKYTPRENCHKVYALGGRPAWAFCIRGPWHDTWTEWNDERKELITLTHGRKEVK